MQCFCRKPFLVRPVCISGFVKMTVSGLWNPLDTVKVPKR